MKHSLFIILLALVAALPTHARKSEGKIEARNVQVVPVNKACAVSADLVLDGLTLAANEQMLVTPILESPAAGQTLQLPTILFSGRNMHYVYLREGAAFDTGDNHYNISAEQRRLNGKPQTYAYNETVPLQPWMHNTDARLVFAYDVCGCGAFATRDLANPYLLALNPVERMLVAPFPTPDPSKRKPTNHNGRARVQFEVDKTELHATPYVCKNGQRIDNRQQLQVIDDSISYALQNPNVEIESISICGYASPESPYDHNDYLATNRSRALSEYIADKYRLPRERSHYSAVPENWVEFDSLARFATDITEQQRADLRQLIAQPCYGPSDYDAKEATLKTDPRFAQLYKTKILPEWFPLLRCTQFTITTQLKPLTPIQLRDVMAKTPELMSLDEIYMVANSYEHGSPEFLEAMAVALKWYPNDPVANGNAAALAIEHKDYAAADGYLAKAGNSPESNVLRGIVATYKGDYDAARRYFEQAPSCPEAQRNLQLIK